MNSRQVMTLAVLAVVLAWSAVLVALGQLAAVAALLPSLGLLIQQIITALAGSARPSALPDGPTAPAAEPTGNEELPR
ncbi:hypothetical protein [Streptomyces sp. NPDC101237]|uniref:hypothetical protein n=1 Tax=Streptomyces sp. NPDC101237 TaxID=3366139 RepID=UPI0037FADD3C